MSFFMANNCYLFTGYFPYGYAESFLENEINFLSKRFSNVYIQPRRGNDLIKRDVPDNVVVYPPVISNNRSLQLLLGTFYPKTIKIYVQEFLEKEVYLSKNKIRNWFKTYILSNIYLKSKNVQSIFRSVDKKDVIYFYWGNDACSILPFVKNSCAKKIVRFHGSDLWEELHHNYIPMRKYVVESMDIAVFISNMGKKYFESRYPDKVKMLVSKLGTLDHGAGEKSNDEVLRVLSCSYIIPLKRVPLIYKALNSISDKNIEWTHIGDGPGLERLKSEIINSNISVKLTGRLTNDEVIKYYRENSVDIFINLSTTEGIPVSIMEAISFNVPVIATDVGGVSEIVNESTGILLSNNPTIKEITDAVEKIKFLELFPRAFWNENYNADTNYKKFTDEILSTAD